MSTPLSPALEEALNLVKLRLTSELMQKVNGSVRVQVAGVVRDFVDSDPRLLSGGSATLEVSDEAAFLALVQGELSPHAALLSGQLKVSGDLGVAMRFTRFGIGWDSNP